MNQMQTPRRPTVRELDAAELGLVGGGLNPQPLPPRAPPRDASFDLAKF